MTTAEELLTERQAQRIALLLELRWLRSLTPAARRRLRTRRRAA